MSFRLAAFDSTHQGSRKVHDQVLVLITQPDPVHCSRVPAIELVRSLLWPCNLVVACNGLARLLIRFPKPSITCKSDSLVEHAEILLTL